MEALCGNGSNCYYQLVSANPDRLTATHTTSNKIYIDDLFYSFNSNDSSGHCQAEGYSRSRVWYAIRDFGTNYCNLRNLIHGADLDQSVHFVQQTDDRICTQYSDRNCDKY